MTIWGEPRRQDIIDVLAQGRDDRFRRFVSRMQVDHIRPDGVAIEKVLTWMLEGLLIAVGILLLIGGVFFWIGWFTR